jgi:uncharacterized protein GlcG (DUF336 family)
MESITMKVCETLPTIGWEAALVAAQGALHHAEKNGWRINAAVVDRGGNLMSFLRMPGAFPHSIEIAIDKAYTAANFGFPTKDWMAAVGHDEGMKFGFSAQPRLIVFGGGLPMRIGDDDEWLGGIGVSGASEAQDEECARAGLKAIGLRAWKRNCREQEMRAGMAPTRNFIPAPHPDKYLNRNHEGVT